MRIIAGKYGRRRFSVPKSFKLRPTTDLAKEALFNTLCAEYDLDGVSVIDLFAGTGSIGLEFMSRGANRIHAVEQNPKHASFISSVVRELMPPPDVRYDVLVSNVRTFLEQSGQGLKSSFSLEPVQFIFADPPYNLSWLQEIPHLIQQSGFLQRGGLIILEHPGEYDFSHLPMLVKHKSYSAVNYSFFCP